MPPTLVCFMHFYCCIYHAFFIPCLLDCSFSISMVLKPQTTWHINVISMATQICCHSSLSLFHLFTEQTLLNTYYVSDTFIGAENSGDPGGIVPALTEPRPYGWGDTEQWIANENTVHCMLHLWSQSFVMADIFSCAFLKELFGDVKCENVSVFLKTKCHIKHTESKLNKRHWKRTIICLPLSCRTQGQKGLLLHSLIYLLNFFMPF